jgi:hypothetical protein
MTKEHLILLASLEACHQRIDKLRFRKGFIAH